MIVSYPQPSRWRWLRVAIVLTAVYLVLHSYLYGASPIGGQAHRILANTTHTSTTADEALCRQSGFEPFRPAPGAPRRKVYDLTMVNNELDWLEIRLNTTWDEVDWFVVVEAPKTYTGLDKPLVLRDNLDLFKAYHSKMIYHVFETAANYKPKSPWEREDLQRNSMFTEVFPRLEGDQAPSPEDVIVVADVDEIPRPVTYQLLRSCVFPLRLTLRSKFYYYGFQFLHRGVEWQHPQATTYRSEATILPADLRDSKGGNPFTRWMEKDNLWNAGWHCSSCFRTVGDLLDKIAAFSHTNMNAEKFRDPKRIVGKVRQGKDNWDRRRDQFDFVDGNEDVPPYIKTQRERFEYLFNRTGADAGFADLKGPQKVDV